MITNIIIIWDSEGIKEKGLEDHNPLHNPIHWSTFTIRLG